MLVGTNVLSETVKPRPNSGVLRWLAAHPRFAISAITLEELAFGIERLEGAGRTVLYEWLELLQAEPSPEVVQVDAEGRSSRDGSGQGERRG